MMRSILWRISSVAVLITGMLVSTVQAQQPTVVLSIRGIDAVLDDADFIANEVGQEGLKGNIEQIVEGATGGKGLAGVDRKKPLGVYWTAAAGESQEMPVAFVPVSDADELKVLVEGLAEDFKEEKGQWSASVNGTPLYGKISGGYLFVSPKLPSKLADPAKIVNAKYDVTLDVSLAGIPAPFKEMFLEKAEAEGRKDQENDPEPANEAERLGREWGFNGTFAVLRSIVNEADKLTLGIDIDSKARTAVTDLSLTTKAGTPLAKVLTAYGKIQPAFAGLGSTAAPFRMVFSLPTIGTPEEIDSFFERVKTTADESIDKDDSLKSDDDRERVKKTVGRLLTMSQATLKSGSMHAGLVVEEGGDDTARLIGGAKVAQGDEAAKIVDDLIEWSKSDPEIPKLKLDVAKHAGARIHSVEMEEDAEKYFGDDDGHLAFRNDSLWLALGGDNLAALKKALDAKPAAKTTVAPISLHMKLAALLLLMKDEEPDEEEPLKKIAGTPGDKFNLDIVPVSNGAKLRIEFGIDLLKLAAELGDKDDDSN